MLCLRHSTVRAPTVYPLRREGIPLQQNRYTLRTRRTEKFYFTRHQPLARRRNQKKHVSANAKKGCSTFVVRKQKLGGASEKLKQVLVFRSACTNFAPKKAVGRSVACPARGMRKVRATQSIPLVNVQGVGDGRVDAEENDRPVQTR